jgi:hypothetical protein
MIFRFGTNSLTLLIMKFLMTQGCVKEEDLVVRLVCFGADEVSTFKCGHLVLLQDLFLQK